MLKAGAWLKSAASDQRGNVAVIFALALPMVIGGVAFGVESGYWYYEQLKLQQAADAAAYAAGVDDRAGKDSSAILAAATAAAVQNGFATASGTIQVNTPPTSGSYRNANSVEVLLTRNERRFFTQIFSTSQVVSNARAVATFTTASSACVLALDPIADRAVQFSGSSIARLNGCTVMANSLATDAVEIQGGASVTAPCVLTAGGVDNGGGLVLTTCSEPITNLPPVGDPLRDIPEPSDTGACLSDNGSTLSPGRYCGGLTLKGTQTLSPGLYIVSGGTFRINANAVISGSGVTFYLTNNAAVSFNGTATINFSAPTSGTYSGILFFGSRENTSGLVSLNGTAGSRMTGTIYFPSQEVDYLGNFSGANGCTHVIGRIVQWNGNASVSLSCTIYGMTDLQIGSPVKLVE